MVLALHFATKRVRQSLHDFPVRIQRKFEDSLSLLRIDPFAGKRLTGKLAGYWSMRVTHSCRILYTFDSETLCVHRMAYHKRAYQ
ncbi:hypothetical protein NPIL_412731 [Nephila pilipes]|uniref:Type II toxin-antitoxin system mRNA interferase toxin, RelE/StbE family n=1 Tax=Nephila pilipes TaxID=299642 RepID=A0A8X6MZV6_NEPPI|nr:hypothetical protein NPIL_412731 [Nephila pilipes]